LKMETVEARRFSETAYRVASLSKRWDCLSKTLIDIGEQLSRTNSANAISMLNEAQWVASKHSLDRLNERCFLLMARIHLVDRDLKAVELSLMQAIAVETSWSGGNPRAAKTSMILRIVGGEDPNATLVKLDNHLLGTA
jgi:hypothetical protein